MRRGRTAATGLLRSRVALHGGGAGGAERACLRGGGNSHPRGDAAADGRRSSGALTVEESGSLALLGERCRRDGPFEAVHLSCHGDICVPTATARRRARCCWRRRGGGDLVRRSGWSGRLRAPAAAGVSLGLSHGGTRAWGTRAVPAEAGGKQGLPRRRRHLLQRHRAGCRVRRRQAEPELAEPSCASWRLGWRTCWAGTARSTTPTRAFAEMLYGELAQGRRCRGRRRRRGGRCSTARAQDPQLGGTGTWRGSISAPAAAGARAIRQLDPRPARPEPEEAFLDPRTSGCRWRGARSSSGGGGEFRRCCGAYRGGRQGVLVHGMGNLGKSSLAARVAARLPDHRTVVVYGKYHALAVFQGSRARLRRSLTACRARRRISCWPSWRRLRRRSPQARRRSGRAAPAADGALNRHPVLLMIDDLERALEMPVAEQAARCSRGLRPALAAVLEAFAAARRGRGCC